jgi:hypothetical protein
MATKKGVKKKEHEKLDDATIERVIELLALTPPITKKEACEILNISYNTTRLTAIITEYQEKVERRKRLFEKARLTPISDQEKSYMVTWYLQGSNFSDISELTYRSPAQVKRVLEELGVPERPRGDAYYVSAPLPEECVLMTSPKKGELVWSARYHAIAEIMSRCINDDGSISYSIYVYEKNETGRRGGFYAYQPLCELGSLKHLEKYIDLKKLIA